jgi:hypothetical protein
MKFWHPVLYLFIGGLLVGFSFNAKYQKCQQPTESTQGHVTAAALWPIVVGLAIGARSEAVVKSKCESPKD